jgi:hypothetical protein
MPRAAATATKAPAKTAGATTKARKPAAKAVEEEPDLLAGLGTPDEPDEDDLDLLAGISEENGTAWMPWDDDDQPVGIQGKVTHVSTVRTDPKYGEAEDVPYLEIQDSKDADTIWSIRGYGFVVRNQIERTDPQVGDTFAIKYLGETDSRNGNTYHNVKAAVRHN